MSEKIAEMRKKGNRKVTEMRKKGNRNEKER